MDLISRDLIIVRDPIRDPGDHFWQKYEKRYLISDTSIKIQHVTVNLFLSLINFLFSKDWGTKERQPSEVALTDPNEINEIKSTYQQLESDKTPTEKKWKVIAKKINDFQRNPKRGAEREVSSCSVISSTDSTDSVVNCDLPLSDHYLTDDTYSADLESDQGSVYHSFESESEDGMVFYDAKENGFAITEANPAVKTEPLIGKNVGLSPVMQAMKTAMDKTFTDGPSRVPNEILWKEWLKIFNLAKVVEWKAVDGEPDTYQLILEKDVESRPYKIKTGVIGDIENHTYIKKEIKLIFEVRGDSKIIHFEKGTFYNYAKLTGQVDLLDIEFRIGTILDDLGRVKKPIETGFQEVLHNYPEKWWLRKALKAAGREFIPLTIGTGKNASLGTDVLWAKDAFPSITGEQARKNREFS